MKSLTAKDAKYTFGNLIDLARAAPVAVTKHGRPVVVVLSVETFKRLNGMKATDRVAAATQTNKKRKK
jgi:prevent-host-death family protein